MDRKNSKSNIVIVGLDSKFNANLSKKLADDLEMFYLNVGELIEYDLISSSEMLDVCGLEYYKKQERKCVKKAVSYENTIIDIKYDLFANNLDIFDENSIVLYIKFSKDQISKNCDIINKINYTDRDQTLKQHSDFIINNPTRAVDGYLKTIYRILGGYLK